VPAVEKVTGRSNTARLGVVRCREQERGIRGEAVGFERPQIGGETVTDVLLGEITDEPDPFVAVPDEVLDRAEGPP
jgi:hypothetical protein